MQDADTPFYRVWNPDRTIAEPIELPTLIGQIRSGRVTAESWIFTDQTNAWMRAAQIPELSLAFKPKSEGASGTAANGIGIKPGSLKRIKVFADLNEPQLKSFLQRMEELRFQQFAQIVAQGDHGDAMYFVMEGEVRARVMIDGSESTLATFGPGEFFGEISLLDQGPRSADVLANSDSLLLKLKASSFQSLLHDDPGSAAPFLFALSRSVVGRMRTLTKRYQDSVHFTKVGAMVH